MYMQHFHYSYVVNAAAVLAHLRPSWATSENVAWVNTLIRDVNGPNKVTDSCDGSAEKKSGSMSGVGKTRLCAHPLPVLDH